MLIVTALRALFAVYLRTNVHTLENWEQGRAKNNEQARIFHHAIREAYVTLKDPGRRKKYDRSLEIQLSSAEIGEGAFGATKNKIMVLILILAPFPDQTEVNEALRKSSCK